MGFLEERDLADVPTIPEYFNGKVIFITGGSGFIGKILIEKLLYSCPRLERIYLLMREKKGVQSEDRLVSIFSSQCFDRLRKEKPGVFKSKVSVLNGDFMEDDLGLSSEDRTLLETNVNIIFHVAASVRFDDPLVVASKMNLGGTQKILDLAKNMRNLSALVHVSTSFCNNNQNPTEEIMYPPHGDWRDTLQICKDTDAETLRILTPKYIGDVPNTYIFTKQLAEHMVYEQRGQLPIVIVRPSIVVSAMKEPMKGWIDNFNGPVGLMVAGGKGIVRITYGQPNAVLDLMPVDICVKNIIAAAWIRGTKKLEPSDDIPIYNCCAANKINMTFQEMVTLSSEVGQELPFDYTLWDYSKAITPSLLIYNTKFFLQHLLPALFIDFLLWILGKTPMLIRIQRRIYNANKAVEPFLSHQWTFKNSNFVFLDSRIKKSDIEEFSFKLDSFDIRKYMSNCALGGRRYLLKEKDENIPKAQARFKRMKIFTFAIKTLFYGYLLWKLVNLLAYRLDISL